MVIINDGKGSGRSVSVSNNNRLDTSARSASRQYYESRDEGQVYTATYIDAGAVANEETAYIQNTSTVKDMVIDQIFIAPDTASQWTVKFVTGTGSGTTVTPVNMNKSSSNTAVVNCLGGVGGVTGLTDDGVIGVVWTPANNTSLFDSNEAIRLGQDDALAIECETSCAVNIMIFFHYDSE